MFVIKTWRLRRRRRLLQYYFHSLVFTIWKPREKKLGSWKRKKTRRRQSLKCFAVRTIIRLGTSIVPKFINFSPPLPPSTGRNAFQMTHPTVAIDMPKYVHKSCTHKRFLAKNKDTQIVTFNFIFHLSSSSLSPPKSKCPCFQILSPFYFNFYIS